MVAPRPTPKLEDQPLSAVRDCLFNFFAATLHIGGRSSIRNLRTRHAVVTGTYKHGVQKYTDRKLAKYLFADRRQKGKSDHTGSEFLRLNK